MDEDDDTVVEEIPVFLSKNLQNNLYVFQYPTKTVNFDTATVENCCVKPINQEVKVDFSLDTESAYYDRFKGEQFAIASDGKTQAKGERPTYRRGIMDRQAFVSTHSLQDVSKYAAAIYADKEIHISPLSCILQLRPSFSHFDKDDKRTKAEQKALNDEADDDEELQQVTVKFARTGTGAKKAKERQGYDNYMKLSHDEPWCETYWHARTSATAELERQKLYATNHRTNHALALAPQKYVEKLLHNEDGAEDRIDSGEDAMPVRVISKMQLKQLTLPEQLKVILKDAKMLSFNEIANILHANVDAKLSSEKILRTLPQVGILIHGNWVPQSELVYPADTLSNANGVCSEQMIRARDYILFQFSRNTFLYRQQVMTTTQLPPAEAFEVMQSVAHLNSEKKWELLLPPDKEFEQRNPELVQRQEMVWRATEQTYKDMESMEKSPKRARKRSIRETKPTSTETTTVTS